MSCGSILIADEDAGTRATVAALVQQAGYTTAEAVSGEEAVELATAERPDLVILEVCLPGLSGYEVCRELRDRYGEQVSIVFLSGRRVETYDRVAGLLVGADDYIVKPFAADELLSRVRRLIERARRSRAETLLTAREREVLQLLAGGREPAEIARDLVITPKTVAKHLEHVLAKLDVHTRAHAVAVAYRNGLL